MQISIITSPLAIARIVTNPSCTSSHVAAHHFQTWRSVRVHQNLCRAMCQHIIAWAFSRCVVCPFLPLFAADKNKQLLYCRYYLLVESYQQLIWYGGGTICWFNGMMYTIVCCFDAYRSPLNKWRDTRTLNTKICCSQLQLFLWTPTIESISINVLTVAYNKKIAASTWRIKW